MSLGNDEADGLVDTNIFIHSLANDALTAECVTFLAALENGELRATLEPIVLHELSYALQRYLRQMTRADIADYLLMILAWPGIVGPVSAMVDAVERWRDAPNLGFADAYLAALAGQRRCPVYTKNVRDLTGQGAIVPDPLPSGRSA